jgi:hypothetical protein
MKKIYLLVTLSFLLILTKTNAQVGIGAPKPDSSAMLDVKSANKGLLIPRVALTGTNDVTTIATPATSLLIYNTATISGSGGVTPGYYYWTGAAWVQLALTKEYAYIYTSGGDFVSSATSIRFFYNGIMTSGIVHAPSSSFISFATPGVYKIEFSVTADNSNQFSIYKNGTEVPGSKYSSSSTSQQNNGMVIVNILSGDQIELRNVSAAANFFPGSFVSASIMITQL